MNDRINLLASKCFDPRRRPESSIYFPYFDMQKFAELIAQESIVDFYRRYLDICSEEDITVQVARYVKEHFGVEE
jgi:hypothetical protein